MVRNAKNKTSSNDKESVKTIVPTDSESNNEGVQEMIEKLKDTDEVVCTSQIPNLSYKDHKTGDFYNWDKMGDTESIRFDVIKDMYRASNAYLTNLWITVEDERVIKHFRLERAYSNYKNLITSEIYTSKTVKEIKSMLDELPKGLINTVIVKIKAMVTDGKISDVRVIRELEKLFNLDLIYLLDM